MLNTSSQHKHKQPMRRGMQIKFKHIVETAESLDMLLLQYPISRHKQKLPMSRGIKMK